MNLWLSRWMGHWKHLRWRLTLAWPLLFTQYVSVEEVYEERELSGWKLALLSVVVLGCAGWSFFI